MGGAGDTYTLQLILNMLPSPAVVQLTGQGTQTNVAKEKT
jgi:hypothetical protein